MKRFLAGILICLASLCGAQAQTSIQSMPLAQPLSSLDLFIVDQAVGARRTTAQASLGAVYSFMASAGLPAQSGTPITWTAPQTYTPPASISGVVQGILAATTNPTSIIGGTSQLDHFRCSQSDGSVNQYLLTATTPTVSCLYFEMQANAGSVASANMYGVIGNVVNLGFGTVAGLYGRATVGAAATGNAIGIKGGVDCSSTAGTCADIQVSNDTGVNGGTVFATLWANSQLGTNVAQQYGVYFDPKIQISTAGLAMYATGAGDLVRLYNSTGSAVFANVIASGNAGFGGYENGHLSLGENLTVKGFAAFGTTGGPVGVYGDTGNGDVVMGAASNHAAELRANNAAVIAVTTGGLLKVTNQSASFVAASNCGSLASSTGCLKIVDGNNNNVFLPVYGTL